MLRLKLRYVPRSLNLIWKVALMLVPKNTEKGGYFWLHARTLKFGKKGAFFISTPRYLTKGYVFAGLQQMKYFLFCVFFSLCMCYAHKFCAVALTDV